MGHASSSRRPWAYLAYLLVVASIWGNWQAVGASSPEDPMTLVLTETGFVWFRWPYVVIDQSGVSVRFAGLLLGLASTAIAAVVLYRLVRVPKAATDCRLSGSGPQPAHGA